MMEPGDGGDEEGDDVGGDGQGGGVPVHEQDGHRPGAEAAQHAGAEHLGHERDEDGGDFILVAQRLVGKAAAERAHHAAGEGHERARADEVADEAGAEGHAHAVAGAQEHGAQDVHHVLGGRALAPEDGEADKGAAHYGERDEYGGDSEFLGAVASHF